MDRSKAHRVVQVTVGGLMGPGPLALEKANEYISEAEHQEGDYYWDQFDYEAELADDVGLYLTECGYLGDGISGAGGNSHPLVGWEPQEPKPEELQDTVSDIVSATADHRGITHIADLRDEPGIREVWVERNRTWLRITISVEPYEPRFYDPPEWVLRDGQPPHPDEVAACEYLYIPRLYRVCSRCRKIEDLGPLDQMVEETGRTYVWRDIPVAGSGEDTAPRSGTIRVAVSMEDPSLCDECFTASRKNWAFTDSDARP